MYAYDYDVQVWYDDKTGQIDTCGHQQKQTHCNACRFAGHNINTIRALLLLPVKVKA